MAKKKKAAKAAKKTTVKDVLDNRNSDGTVDFNKLSKAVLNDPAGAEALSPLVGSTEAADAGRDMLRTGGDPTFQPHADSPTLEGEVVAETDKADAEALAAAINAPPPTGVDRDALLAELATTNVKVAVLDTVEGSVVTPRPLCAICGGEMKSNVCPADGYHLVDAP
jgi:hypothetical protein